MEVTKKLAPGAHSTKRYLTRFGKRLICARFRLDRSRQLRLTTTLDSLADNRAVKPVTAG